MMVIKISATSEVGSNIHKILAEFSKAMDKSLIHGSYKEYLFNLDDDALNKKLESCIFMQTTWGTYHIFMSDDDFVFFKLKYLG